MTLNSYTLEKSNDDESSSFSFPSSPPQLNVHYPTHKRFSSSGGGQYMTLFSAFRPEYGLVPDNSTHSPYTVHSSHHRSKSMSSSSYHIPLYDQYPMNNHISQTAVSEMDGIPMVLI